MTAQPEDDPMTLTVRETEDAVSLEPALAARSTVIWLHGLGADGHDFVPLVPELRLPDTLAVRFIFPNAPVRPVTINGGYEMRAWYDITTLTAAERADAAGLAASVSRINALIADEITAGIPAARIIVAGFSQGGAVALHAALGATPPVGGVIALSTYLPHPEVLERRLASPARSLPVLMCHGRRDPVVQLGMGIEARDWLIAAGYAVDWHEYPMEHELCAAEIGRISAWLGTRCAGA
jgi:phospholipase/carboxylesterase